ncbi:MAG: hypothetical protein JWQ89_808 [Devosia sp.]|uniref:lysozyme inhibitor LprI family protein n=1 Tax=Devosia sp. TaxID=1871048 RepID=UPI002613A612|nr:hypothetical protein [Devosia sp.]MDB5539081.1 hypothetical protein [Devosia sp.]
MRAIIGLFLLVFLSAAPVHAASFDCSKASAADEVAVCRDGTLSGLDSEMGGLFYAYDKVPMFMGGNGARHDAAEAFLSDRRACGSDLTCLRRVYTARIAALKQGIEGSMQQFSDLQNNAPPITVPVPPAIETLIAGYAEQCKNLGGTLDAGSDRPGLLSGDLDGDGIADYVLNSQNLKCSTGAPAYCSSAGCAVDLAVSSDGFATPIKVVGRTPTLVQNDTGTTARLAVDSSNCPGAKPEDACWASYSWNGGKSQVSYAVEPTAGM